MAQRPEPSSDHVRRRFKRQKRSDTKPELMLRRELHRRGLRYRVDRAVPGDRRRRVDIVFGPARVAVFVDGCFWHSCPEHGNTPKANREWWAEKLQRNVRRDQDTNRHLADAGWLVVRVWEHQVVKDVIDVADTIERAVRERRT